MNSVDNCMFKKNSIDNEEPTPSSIDFHLGTISGTLFKMHEFIDLIFSYISGVESKESNNEEHQASECLFAKIMDMEHLSSHILSDISTIKEMLIG